MNLIGNKVWAEPSVENEEKIHSLVFEFLRHYKCLKKASNNFEKIIIKSDAEKFSGLDFLDVLHKEIVENEKNFFYYVNLQVKTLKIERIRVLATKKFKDWLFLSHKFLFLN